MDVVGDSFFFYVGDRSLKRKGLEEGFFFESEDGFKNFCSV